MHGSVVLAQLEALGVLEAVALMSLGFPTRIPYATIHGKYSKALPPWASSLPPRELVEAIATAAEVQTTDVQYGTTSLFCRSGKAAFLERLLGSGDGSALDDANMLPALQSLLETFERKKKAMPIVKKNLHMWVHRRRYLALKQQKRVEAEAISRAARERLKNAALQVKGAVGATRFLQGKVQEHEEAEAAEELRKRQSTAARRIRKAALASRLFAGARLKQAQLKVDGYFEGTVVHAGHLRFECFMGLEGRMLPRGECYCVLLSGRTLLCFEIGSGSFNPSTGEAVGAMPIPLDGNTASVLAAPAADGSRLSTAFQLRSGDGHWLAQPALYDQDDRPTLAKAVRVWVRRISATLLPEHARGSRGTRASLARTTSALARRDEDEDDEDDEEAEKKPQKKQVFMSGAWANGCFYREGAVAYYESPCIDDPYV